LFLLPSELGFLRFLKVAKVPLNEYQFPQKKVSDVQKQVSLQYCTFFFSSVHDQESRTMLTIQLENLINKNHYLNTSARDGYRSYLQSYASYSLKKIFDVNNLDLAKVGKAFGFNVPPKVNISVGSVKGKKGKDDDEEAESEDEGVVRKAYYRNRNTGKGKRD
jgi:ATP-dependent RNA helicase DDX18/HAS1